MAVAWAATEISLLTELREVNDSEPEAKFQETVNKSKAMLKAVALAETFAKTP